MTQQRQLQPIQTLLDINYILITEEKVSLPKLSKVRSIGMKTASIDVMLALMKFWEENRGYKTYWGQLSFTFPDSDSSDLSYSSMRD